MLKLTLYIFLFIIVTHKPTLFFFFFFNDTATTEIYTLSLHDALPISSSCRTSLMVDIKRSFARASINITRRCRVLDRKSTRLNSSHLVISYAVFCLKKKKKISKLTLHNVSTKIFFTLRNLALSPLYLA